MHGAQLPATEAVHARPTMHPIPSRIPRRLRDAAVPTWRASTIVYDDAESFSKRSNGGFDGYTHALHGTPTTRTLEAQLTALHGVRTFLDPSGQAAVTIDKLASSWRVTASSSRITSNRPSGRSAPPT